MGVFNVDKTKVMVISILTGFFSGLAQKYGILALLVTVSILMDVITGLLKAKVTQKVSSVAGTKGFWKKVSLMAGFVFGIFLDYLELYLIENGANELNLSIPFSIPIGLIVGVYIILNESISICENLYQSGCKMPVFLIKALQVSHDSIDSGEIKKNSDQH